MTGSDYQGAAMRTNDGNCTERLGKKIVDLERIDKPECFSPITEDIGGVINASLGLSGEIGELNDMIKKWIFHENIFDVDHAKKELGDVLWYAALMSYSFGWNFDEIMEMNIQKLRDRYPEGFDTDHANNRKEGDI